MVTRGWGRSDLHELELGQVLRIDQANRFEPGVHHDEIIDVAFVENPEGFRGQGSVADGNGAAGHHAGEAPGQQLVIGRHAPTQIAIGEHADQSSAVVDDADAAGFGAAHDEESIADAETLAGDGVAFAGAHDIADFEEQRASDGAGRVVAGEVFLGETAGLEDGHGEGIAHDQHGGGAGGWGQVEGAGFARDAHIERDVTDAGQGGLGGAGHGDDADRESFESRNEVQQFLRFPRVTQGENEVAVVDDAEVAMECIDTAEHHAGGSGTGEGGGDFAADVAGLADADDDDFAALPQRADDEIDGRVEVLVEVRPHGPQSGQFDVEHLAGFGDVAHEGEVANPVGAFQRRIRQMRIGQD